MEGDGSISVKLGLIMIDSFSFVLDQKMKSIIGARLIKGGLHIE